MLNTVAYARRVRRRATYSISHYFMVTNYLKNNKITKLQIGSGSNILSGWLNTDLNPSKNVVFLDVTKKFPFNDCTFDYIFTEHLIEHLDYITGNKLIKECYRVLKPQGVLRISTPNLRFLVDLYNDNKTDLQKRYIKWEIDNCVKNTKSYTDTIVINNFFRAWGHKFIYDFKTLSNLLSENNFGNIRRCVVGNSEDIILCNIESHGKKIGEEYNKLESMAIEATRP